MVAALGAAWRALTGALEDVVDSIEVNPLVVRGQGRGVAGVDLVVVPRNTEHKER